MAESKRKSKMISLRLSSAEYEALRAIHASFGARSVSDFARQAMRKVIAGGVPEGRIDSIQISLHSGCYGRGVRGRRGHSRRPVRADFTEAGHEHLNARVGVRGVSGVEGQAGVAIH